MKCVTRMPSLGAGRLSKSMYGLCSAMVTSSLAAFGGGDTSVPFGDRVIENDLDRRGDRHRNDRSDDPEERTEFVVYPGQTRHGDRGAGSAVRCSATAIYLPLTRPDRALRTARRGAIDIMRLVRSRRPWRSCGYTAATVRRGIKRA